MITQYFDINQRQVIQAPGTLAPASLQPWVYNDNYNLAVYLTGNGVYQTIGPNDSLTVMLFQPGATLPENNLAIVSTPVVNTDAAGFTYYQINVNLGTTGLANLVQANNQPAKCNFHYIFNPATGERFSSSADVPVTVNPDPSKDATGATPVPPGYPSNPNVFEQIANKGVVNGYAALDGTGKVPAAQLPASTAGGDMLKSVYDTNNNGIVDTCDTLQVSRVIGLGSAATQNVPASGNASPSQVVLGSDSRLADSRTPVPHQATHNGGSDPIPLASPSAQGLCPTIDGTTIQIVSGKLTATSTGNGDMLKSVFATNNPLNTTGVVDNALSIQTHQVPATGNASGAQLVIATDTRLADSRNPLAHAPSHLIGGADPIALASAAAAGLCPPVDNATIQVSAGKLAAILATASAPGIVKPDGSTITIAGGVISTVGATPPQHGWRIQAASGQTTSATVGTETAINFQAATGTAGQTFDTDGVFASANPGYLTIKNAGYYMIGANLFISGGSAGAWAGSALYRNAFTAGVYTNQLVRGICPNIANPPDPAINYSTCIYLNAGDTIYCSVKASVASLTVFVPTGAYYASLIWGFLV